MKHTILTCAAAALVALPIFADDKAQSSSTSSSVITNADGTATITIDVNGKKETKTFKLGGGDPVRVEIKDGVVVADGGKKEKVTFLGVAPGPVSDDLRAQLPLKAGEGIKVNHVAEDSPAAKAGIQEHDILTRLDDQILVEPQQLKTLVKMRKPGDEVKLSLLRKGEQKEVKVVLSETEEKPFDGSPFNMQMHGFGDLQKQLEDMKGKLPGGVFHRKGIVIGPDGKTHTFDGDDMDEIIEAARKQLESAGMTKDQIESIMRSMKGAIKGSAKELKDVLKGGTKDLHELFGKDKDKKDAAEEKKGAAEEKKDK